MRSLLLVPHDDETKLAAGLASGADAVIVDLEGSLAPPAEPRARAAIAACLGAARTRAPRPRLYVLLHALDDRCAEAELGAAMAVAPDGIALPRCRDGADVQRLAARLAVHEARLGLADGATRILALATDSASALLGFASYRGASARLVGIAWRAETLAANLGAETSRTANGAYAGPYALARALTLIGAVAAGVAPIDAAFGDVGDATGLGAEAEAARRDGFVGKIAVDPTQVAIINAAFAPSPDSVAKARAVVAAFAAQPGAGAVTFNGETLDCERLALAKDVLERAQAL